MALSIRTKLIGGFGVSLGIIAAIGAGSYVSTVNLVNNSKQVDKTHEVLEGLERIVSRLKDAETGQRGFVITGEDHYLEPYYDSQAEVEAELQNVRALTSDNADQQRRLDTLEPLIDQKLSELNYTISLRRNKGFESALEVVSTDTGKRIMDDIRAVLTQMEQEERQLLEQRAVATASTATRAKFADVFGATASFVGLGLYAFFLSRGIYAPITGLKNAALQIGRGDLGTRVAVGSKDELGDLAFAFNRMAGELQQITSSLELSNRKLKEEIAEHAQAEVALHSEMEVRSRAEDAQRRLLEERSVVDEVARIMTSTLDIDQVYEQFVGELKKLVHFDRVDINFVDQDTGIIDMRYVSGLVQQGRLPGDTKLLAGTETQHLMETGKSLVRRKIGAGIKFPSDEVFLSAGLRSSIRVPLIAKSRIFATLCLYSCRVGAFGPPEQRILERLARQIAPAVENAGLYEHRMLAEEELKTLAANLARSNRELQDFASAASHDLQEPLRKVQAFGDRLRSGYGDLLAERGQDYLNRMLDAARRMKTLIDDLLTLSRLDTRDEGFVPVDLVMVVEGVLSDLEVTIEQVGARVEVEDLPTIDADPTQMRQLLQNLIGNALKFQRPEEPPVVKIGHHFLYHNIDGGTMTDGSRLVNLTVEDNGIGFEEKYVDRIFRVFERLHSREDYGGTGIGLAVCRKIAERHGGTITAKSKPGQGATFVVTLPVEQPKGQCAGLTGPQTGQASEIPRRGESDGQ